MPQRTCCWAGNIPYTLCHHLSGCISNTYRPPRTSKVYQWFRSFITLLASCDGTAYYGCFVWPTMQQGNKASQEQRSQTDTFPGTVVITVTGDQDSDTTFMELSLTTRHGWMAISLTLSSELCFVQLTHWALVMPYDVTELSQHRFR